MPKMNEFCSTIKSSVKYNGISTNPRIRMLLLCDRTLVVKECEEILFLCEYDEAVEIINKKSDSDILNLLISDVNGHTDNYEELKRTNLNYVVTDKPLVGMNNTLTKIFHQYNRYKKALDIVIANQGGLDPIIKQVSTLMGGKVSIYVLSNTFQVIASCTSEDLNTEIKSGELGIRKDLNDEQLAFMMSCLSNNKSVKYHFDVVKDKDMIIGYTMMICDDEIEIYDMFKNMLNRRIANIINKSYTIYSSEQKELQKLLTEILLVPSDTPEILEEKLNHLPYPLKPIKRILIVSRLNDDAPIWPMCSKLESIFPNHNITVYDGYIVVLFSGKNFLFRPTIDHERFSEFLEQNTAFAMFTTPSKWVYGLRTVYMQAKDLLPKLPLMVPEKSNRYVFFEDVYNYYRVHLSISGLKKQYGHENIAYLLHPVAVEIIRYDMKNNTDYFNFITTYALCDGNIGEASVNLHMHRNSVYNKLKKMGELFDTDFSSGVLLRNMIFSMHVLQYTNNDPLKVIKKE